MINTEWQEQQQIKRRQHFTKWWRVNKKRNKALVWLTKEARRCIFAYAIDPHQFTEIQTIVKRFNNSEYKTMSRRDSWRLWKLLHPLPRKRIQQLQATAEHLKTIQKQKKEDIQVEVKSKAGTISRSIPRTKINNQDEHSSSNL